MKMSFLLASISALMMAPFSQSATLPAPPKAEQFVEFGAAELAQLLSRPAWTATQELVRKHGCSPDDVVGFRSPHTQSKLAIVTVTCDQPKGIAETDPRYYAYLDFPLTIVVLGDSATEVDLNHYGFMYDSGQIAFITDIDHDNKPQFWLKGEICECDDEREKDCDCEGGITVEFKNGSLQRWLRGWNDYIRP
jgi:hypothetical protein